MIVARRSVRYQCNIQSLTRAGISFQSIVVIIQLDFAMWPRLASEASIAQLGERKTEDLEALCSIHSRGILFVSVLSQVT